MAINDIVIRVIGQAHIASSSARNGGPGDQDAWHGGSTYTQGAQKHKYYAILKKRVAGQHTEARSTGVRACACVYVCVRASVRVRLRRSVAVFVPAHEYLVRSCVRVCMYVHLRIMRT